MERRGPVEVLTFACFDGLPVDVVVTGRSGGVSGGPYATLNLGGHVGDDPDAVEENWRRAAEAVGLRPAAVVTANQVHGSAVAVVDAHLAGAGPVDGVDVLVTDDPRIGVAIRAADCVPVALYDPVGHRVAAVHAGWRGTVARAAGAAVAAMVERGSRPGDLLAAVGPAVPPERYQVGPEVAGAVVAAFGPDPDFLAPDGTGRHRLDLTEANRRVLGDAGVDPARTVVAGVATGGGGPFFSDREHRPCGRFALIARLR